MQNIQKNTTDNLGGLFTFYFIPVEDVVSIPDALRKNISSAVTLASGKAFYSAEITLDSFSYKESQSVSDEGNSYPVAIAGFVAGDSSDLLDLIEEMGLKRFIVMCEDNNNKRRLAGTLHNPMRFKADFDTGGKFSVNKGWSILFYNTFSDVEGRPPFYLSSFPAYENPSIVTEYDIQALLDRIAELEASSSTTSGIPDMAIGSTFIVA